MMILFTFLRSVILSVGTLMTIVASSLLLRLALSLLRLDAPLRLGPLVESRGKILQRGDKVDPQVPLRFMGQFNGFSDPFDRSREVFEGVVNPLQADRDGF
jgi:hypothetical protein